MYTQSKLKAEDIVLAASETSISSSLPFPLLSIPVQSVLMVYLVLTIPISFPLLLVPVEAVNPAI